MEFVTYFLSLSVSLSLFPALKGSTPGLGESRPRLRWYLDGVGLEAGSWLPEGLPVSFMVRVAFSVLNYCISSFPHVHFQPVHLQTASLLCSTHTLGSRGAVTVKPPEESPVCLLDLISAIGLLEG